MFRSASVQIIEDVNSRVSAMIPSRGVYGIVSWDGGRYLRMYGLPLINDVKPGDTIFTTGFGNVFPGGILVGTVGKEPIREVEISRASMCCRRSITRGCTTVHL